MYRLLKLIIKHGFILSSIAFIASCDSESTHSKSSVSSNRLPELIVAGSTFAHPFFEKVLERYSKNHPEMTFTYRSIGSGAGIEEFIDGTADIGTTDAPLNSVELARLNAEIDEVIVSSGMISIAYHLDGIDGSLNLPRDVYPDIFLGKINRWDDPRLVIANPDIELPSKTIQVVARSDSSGTTFAFTNHLAAISQTWKAGPGAAKLIDWPGSTMVANGNEGVAQRLAITKNSIGYVEFGFAQRLGLKVARLENKSKKFVLPGNETGDRALPDSLSSSIPTEVSLSISDPVGDSSYPIVAYTWALIHRQYGDPDKTRTVRDLIQWTLSDGQALAKPLFYLPLSADIVQAGNNKLSGGDPL